MFSGYVLRFLRNRMFARDEAGVLDGRVSLLFLVLKGIEMFFLEIACAIDQQLTSS